MECLVGGMVFDGYFVDHLLKNISFYVGGSRQCQLELKAHSQLLGVPQNKKGPTHL
jgi:hypothetical protein